MPSVVIPATPGLVLLHRMWAMAELEMDPVAIQTAQCLPRRDVVVSIENQTLTTDTAAPYHHAQQPNQLTTAVITGNHRGIFFHEELNTKDHM